MNITLLALNALNEIRRFGQHRGGCALIDRSEPCDCGLEDAEELSRDAIAILRDAASIEAIAGAVTKKGRSTKINAALKRVRVANAELLEACYITSNCSPITKDLEAMHDDAEIVLTFTAADLKQIRAAPPCDKESALTILDELMEQIEMRAECLRDEIAAEEEEWR